MTVDGRASIRGSLRLIGVALVLAAASGFGIRDAALAKGKSANRIWVGTWASSPASPPGAATTFADRTLRQIVHTSIGGDMVRVRFSNVFGTERVRIDAASIGLHEGGGRIVAGTLTTLTFGGEPSITIPTGARVFSDAADLAVDAGQGLAISLHVAAESQASTIHLTASQTSYVSPSGDFVTAEQMPAGTTEIVSWYWLTGVDVLAHRTTKAVVAVGDSITDGLLSTQDANARWPDVLARRLNDRRKGAKKRVAVLNAGISGNRVLTSGLGPNQLARFDRDVLTQTGVTHVILLEGINDIGFPELPGFEDEDVSAAAIIAGMKQLIERAHARGLTIYGGTIVPYKGAFYYSDDGEAKRQAVNDFIRHGGAFDGVVDFDEALRDPADPLRMLPEYDSGDHLHPGDAGYEKMGETVDLKLFKRRHKGP